MLKVTLYLQRWIPGESSLPANNQPKMTISVNTLLRKNQDYNIVDLMIEGKGSPRTVWPKEAPPKLEGKYPI